FRCWGCKRSSDTRLPRAKIVPTETPSCLRGISSSDGSAGTRRWSASRFISTGSPTRWWVCSEVGYLPRRGGADLGSICVGVTTRDLTASRFPLQPCGGPFEAGCQLGECLERGGGNAVPGAFAEPACAGGRGRGVKDSSSRPRTRCEETFAHLAMGCCLHATDRLPECGQPAGGAISGPTKGDRHPQCAWGAQDGADSFATGGKPAGFDCRRCGRSAVVARGNEV